MNVLVIDGHPDEGRLLTTLLDIYVASLDPGTTITRIAVRDLHFDPNLRAGYNADQPWEPDLQEVAHALGACDHLVTAFPLWWGSEPAMLKGLLDRICLPGVTFSYHRDDPFWDRHMVGRSADVLVTMDTPPWYSRLVYGDAVMRRWRSQVLGFCGFHPVRLFRFGPTKRGAAQKNMNGWKRRLGRAASTAGQLRRPAKTNPILDRSRFVQAIQNRKS
jgi:putative NADPH-quinone reductase